MNEIFTTYVMNNKCIWHFDKIRPDTKFTTLCIDCVHKSFLKQVLQNYTKGYLMKGMSEIDRMSDGFSGWHYAVLFNLI